MKHISRISSPLKKEGNKWGIINYKKFSEEAHALNSALDNEAIKCVSDRLNISPVISLVTVTEFRVLSYAMYIYCEQPARAYVDSVRDETYVAREFDFVPDLFATRVSFSSAQRSRIDRYWVPL